MGRLVRGLSFVAALACAACTAPTGGAGSFSRDEIVRTCALQVSCLGEDALLRPVGSCVRSFQLGIATGAGIFFGPNASQLRHIAACGAGAMGCTSALECVSYGHGPDYCAANPGSSCDGTVRVVCDSATGWALLSEDCADRGLACMVGARSDGSPLAVCTDGVSCDPATFESACEGTRVTSCTSVGLRASSDCAAIPLGATCGTEIAPDGTSRQTCVPNGAPCAFSGTMCEGASIVACSNGREARLDCAAVVEGTCVIEGTDARCVENATECSDGDPDRCDGASLASCVNGRSVAIACASLGLRTCAASPDGAACIE